jgi:hypothetical protein
VKRKTFVLAALVTVSATCAAEIQKTPASDQPTTQQSTARPSNSPLSPSPTASLEQAPQATPPQTPTPNQNPASLSLPGNITVELKGLSNPSSGLGSLGSTGLAALFGAVGVVVGAWITSRTQRKIAGETTKTQREIAGETTKTQREIAGETTKTQLEIAGESRKHETKKQDKDIALAKEGQEQQLSLEMIKIEEAAKRLKQEMDSSGKEIYLAATRLVHERQTEQAKLIHMFSDKLLSEREQDRALALFAVSSFVDPDVIERLAKGGDALVSRSSLSKLAASGRDAAASTAQEVLNEGASRDDRNSIVLVYLTEDGQMEATGFFCRESIIVTSAIAEVGKQIYYRHVPNDKLLLAKCIAADPANLIVVAQVDGKGAHPLRLRSDEFKLDPEHPCVVTAWQRGIDGKFIVRTGIVKALHVSDFIASGVEKRQAATDLIEISIFTEQGWNGAPVFDDRGSIMAMLVARKHFQELSYAVPVTLVEEVMRPCETEDKVR